MAYFFIYGYTTYFTSKVIQVTNVGAQGPNIIMVNNIGTGDIQPDEIRILVDGQDAKITDPRTIRSNRNALFHFISPKYDSYLEITVVGPTNTVQLNKYVDVHDVYNLVFNDGFEYWGASGWSSGMTVETTDSHSGSNSSRSTGSHNIYSTDFIPYSNNNDTVKLNLFAKSVGAGGNSRLYAGFRELDKDRNLIYHRMVQYYENTKTTLAAPLNPGATTVTLASGANWKDASAPYYQRYVGIWNTGEYPDYTYTRTVPSYSDISGNVVTLSAAWPGPAIPAGTPVANMFSGSGYNYVAAAGIFAPGTWTEYSGEVSGWKYGQDTDYKKFRYGTRYIQVLLLANYAQDPAFSTLFDDFRVNIVE
jgi:hypothetical protein